MLFLILLILVIIAIIAYMAYNKAHPSLCDQCKCLNRKTGLQYNCPHRYGEHIIPPSICSWYKPKEQSSNECK